jgi:predicted phage terminase large subunit-like protein
LQDPRADEVQGFKTEWLRYWDRKNISVLNLYLLCDPAGEKKKDNDYTVMLIIGLGPDQNYYLVDGIRSRLNLTERTKKIIQLHRKYHPIRTGYEKYGKDSDIEHIEYVQNLENYRFDITPLGGPMPKNDRIRKLIPLFESGKFYLPTNIKFIDHDKKGRDLIKDFVDEEYEAFPVAVHDDIFDCMARIVDPDLMATFPIRYMNEMDIEPDYEESY